MNHQQESERLLKTIESGRVPATLVLPTLAQTAAAHATLALVEAQNRTADELAGIREQARIANLIALDSTEALWTLHYNENEGIEGKGVSAKLRPEIASALGIGD